MSGKKCTPDIREVEDTVLELLVALQTAFYPLDVALDYFSMKKAPEGTNQYEYDKTHHLLLGGLKFVREAQGITEQLFESFRGAEQ